MRVIIVGCDRLGAELAYRLSMHDHEVAVVDMHRSSFLRLNKDFHGRNHEGDPLSQDVLLRAGIEEAESLLALTESESTNFVIGYAAKELYQVPQVIVRISDTSSGAVCELMGLQAISSAIWGAEQLEEMLSHKDFDSVYSVAGGEVEIYTVTVPHQWDNRLLGELLSEDDGQRAVSLTRSGNSHIPGEQEVIKKDDILYIAAIHEGIEGLRAKLNQGDGEGA